MIRILDRLVIVTFLRIFVAFVLGAPGLFVLGDMTERLHQYLDRGLSMGDVMLGYLYQMPLFITWSFPIAALIAAVFTVQNMTVHREIVAAKAGGISFHRLILPLILMGFGLAGAGLYLMDIVPAANRRAGQVLRSEDPRREWRADFVYQAIDGRTLSARRLTVENGKMLGVVIEREGRDPFPTRHLTAEEAVWDSVTGWTLMKGYYRQFTRDGTETAFQFEALRPRAFTERPDELTETPPHEDEMTYAEMGRLITIVEGSGGDANRLRVLREQKLAIPIVSLVIILFGAPLATSSSRGGAAYGIGIALGSVLFYMSLFKVALAAGSSGAVDPILAAWTPNGVFLVTGLFLLARVRT
jgi:lipopolysaccharide export system permease protein